MNKLKINEKYEKLDKLGEGAFGIVYKGQNKLTKEFVAIKEVNLKNLESFMSKEDLKKEIKFMKIFNNNPNSVKLYEDFEENDILYMVIELCDTDITKCLEKSEKGFTIYEVKIVMKQFNNILQDIRKKDMIHNDVKLENVLVKFGEAKEFQIKLIDYGQAKLISSTKDLSNNEWGITPYTEGGNEIISIVEKVDLLNLGIDIFRMLFKEAYKTLEYMNEKIENCIEDKDLKDLMRRLLVDDYKKRIDWDDYFNHDFFKIDKFEFDKVINIVKE